MLTRVVGLNCVRVIAWYDNEWGYSCHVDIAGFTSPKNEEITIVLAVNEREYDLGEESKWFQVAVLKGFPKHQDDDPLVYERSGDNQTA